MKYLVSALFLLFPYLLLAQTANATDQALIEKINTYFSGIHKKSVSVNEPVILEAREYLENRPPGDTSLVLADIHAWVAHAACNSYKYDIANAYTSDLFNIHAALAEVPIDRRAMAMNIRSLVFEENGQIGAARMWNNQARATLRTLGSDLSEENLSDMRSFQIAGARQAMLSYDIELGHLLLKAIGEPPFRGADAYLNGEVSMIKTGLADFSGDYPKAIEGYKRVIQFFESDGPSTRRYSAVAMKSNLANCYLKMNRLEEAKATLKEVRQETIEFVEPVKPRFSWYLLSNANAGLVHIYGKQKNMSPIAKLAEEGLECAYKYYDKRTGIRIGDMYIALAEAYTLDGQFEQADRYLDSARLSIILNERTWGPARLPIISRQTMVGREAVVNYLVNKQLYFIEASKKGEKAANLENALLTYYTLDSLMKEGYHNLSLTSTAGQYSRNGIKYHEKGVEIALQLYGLNNDDKYLDIAWQAVSSQKSLLLKKGLNAFELAKRLDIPAELTDKKANLELRVKRLESTLVSEQADDQQAIRDSIVLSLNALNLLNEQIATDYPKFALALQGSKRPSASQVMQAMGEDEALIEFFYGNDSIYVFTLSPQLGIQVSSLAVPDQATEWITTVVKDAEVAKETYRLLLEPAIKQLPVEVDRLHLIPDGQLWNLPFAALMRGDRFLVRDYAISYAYSAGLLYDEDLKKAVENTRNSFAGFGISYDAILKNIRTDGFRSAADRDLASLNGLPFAKEEVETLGKITSGNIWLDDDATKSAFFSAIPNHQTFHLAMHGLTDPDNPLENALVFASDQTGKEYELLTTREILAQKIPARLTVLSACHTGAGPLEPNAGVQSMARAFSFAGVKATLASNWEANDEVTRNIMVRFYEEVRQGKPLDVAQQIATLAYLDQVSPAFQKPEYWANLTLTGFTQPIYHNGWPWWVFGLLAIGLGSICGMLWRNFKS